MKTVYSVDAENLFTQYSWILENYDIRQVLDDFIEKEKSSLQDVELDYDLLYEQILGKKVTIENITEKDLNLLNYVLKYQKGVYRKGETILETDDPGYDEIEILEPGYYQIEVSGASGNHGSGEWFNYANLRNGKNSYFTDDGIELRFDPEGSLAWAYILDKRNIVYYGKCEINRDAIFFFLDDDIIKGNYLVDAGDKNLDRFIEIARSHEINHDNLYDYSIINFNPLSADDSFGTIGLMYNGLTFKYGENSERVLDESSTEDNPKLKDRERDIFYKSIDCISGLNTFDHLKKLSRYETPVQDGYYKDNITKNLGMNTLKTFSFREIIGEDTKVNPLLFKNSSHGGDGAYTSLIVKLTDKDTGKWYYKVGKITGNGSQPEGNTFLYNKRGTKFIFSEGGGNVSGNNGDFVFEPIDKKLSFLKNLEITDNPYTKNHFVDISSKDFTNKLSFHVGEQPFNDPSIDWKDGMGRAFLIDKNDGIVFTCEGGGEKGTGLRLNNFENGYWESGHNGRIKITYLGASQCKKNKVDFVMSDDVASNTYIDGGAVPVGTDMALSFHTNHYLDGIDFNDSYSEDEEISSDVYEKILKCNFKRDLNYFKAIVRTTSRDRRLVLYGVEKGNFLVEKTNNDAVISCKIPSVIDGHSSDFSIGTGDDGQPTYVKFKNPNFDYDKKLLSVYNNFNLESGESIIIENPLFDAVNAVDILDISKSYHFLLLQTLKAACQLQVVPKNKLDLPEIRDNAGTVTHLNEKDTSVSAIYYSISKPQSEEDLIPYVFGSKLNCSEGMEIYFKFEFNSSRIILDDSISSFPIGTVFYEKNYDIISNLNMDTMPSERKGFQWVKIIAPATSQTINVFVKRECYTLEILPDLYSEFIPTVVNSKKDFEPFEEAQVIIPMKAYHKFSILEKDNKFSNYTTRRAYSLKDDIYSLESFFKFSYLDDVCQAYTFNLCECEMLAHAFSSSYTNDDGEEECTLKTNSARSTIFLEAAEENNVEKIKIDQLRCLFYEMSLKDVYKTFDENISIFFKFKKNDILIRFSSDYLPFRCLVNADNGDSFSIPLVKPYKFVVAASGGPSGNGGNGGNGRTKNGGTTLIISKYYPREGGCGGDGYVGGAGGKGADDKAIGIKDDTYKIPLVKVKILKQLGITEGYGSSGGTGGLGFMSPGANGSNGVPTLSSRCRIYSNEYIRAIHSDQVRRYTTAYVGAMFKTCISIYNTKTGNPTDVKALVSGRTGRQGTNGIDGGTASDGYGSCGSGGGGGTITSLIVSGDYKICFDNSNPWGLLNDMMQPDCIWRRYEGQLHKGFVLFGGLPGNARSFNFNKNNSRPNQADTVYWWPGLKIIPFKLETGVDTYDRPCLTSYDYGRFCKNIDTYNTINTFDNLVVSNSILPLHFSENNQKSLIDNNGPYTAGCSASYSLDGTYDAVSPILIKDHPDEASLLDPHKDMMFLINDRHLYSSNEIGPVAMNAKNIILERSWATKSASAFSTGSCIIFSARNHENFKGNSEVISFKDNDATIKICELYEDAIDTKKSRSIYADIDIRSWKEFLF